MKSWFRNRISKDTCFKLGTIHNSSIYKICQDCMVWSIFTTRT